MVESDLCSDCLHLGELGERKPGITKMVVFEQTKVTTDNVKMDWNKVILAYEPYGPLVLARLPHLSRPRKYTRSYRDGRIPMPDAVTQNNHIFYGSSVTGATCKELASQPDVDSFLLGGIPFKPELVDVIHDKH
jgi:triosephosphate isomerase